MAKGKRRLKDWVVFIGIFIAVIIFAFVLEWWQKHPAIAWTLLAVAVVILGFSLYRFQGFRQWVFKRSKDTGKKIVFTDEAPGREPIPPALYSRVMNQANNRCQNPDCRYQGKPQIHHIDQNNRNNSFWNLIALCPNCHNDAHRGKYTFSQLRNWNKMKSISKPVQR